MVARASGEPVVDGSARSRVRYLITRLGSAMIVRACLRLRVRGLDRLPRGGAVLCFNHQNWTDPFVLGAVLPLWPRLWFFGPKEEDMSKGARNRLMTWSGMAVPYRPSKDDLVASTRRADAILRSGGWLAIAGEGRIHAGEAELLPLSEGAAFFALHAGVPVVPIAVNGTSWLRIGRRIRIRVGEPIRVEGRARREEVDALTARTWAELHALCQGFADPRPPGRFGRWLTEVFNDWPEGARPPVPASGARDARRTEPPAPPAPGARDAGPSSR